MSGWSYQASDKMTSFQGDIREDAEKMTESMLSVYEPVLFAINNDRF